MESRDILHNNVARRQQSMEILNHAICHHSVTDVCRWELCRFTMRHGFCFFFFYNNSFTNVKFINVKYVKRTHIRHVKRHCVQFARYPTFIVSLPLWKEFYLAAMTRQWFDNVTARNNKAILRCTVVERIISGCYRRENSNPMWLHGELTAGSLRDYALFCFMSIHLCFPVTSIYSEVTIVEPRYLSDALTVAFQ